MQLLSNVWVHQFALLPTLAKLALESAGMMVMRNVSE